MPLSRPFSGAGFSATNAIANAGMRVR